MNHQAPSRQALITGAGTGIGRLVAEHLAARGFQVTGTVRDEARAEALSREYRAKSLPLRFLTLQLSSAASIEALADHVTRDGGPDLVVHNAGFGVFGPVEHVPLDRVQEQFSVNLFGPLELTRRLLPVLRARKGQVIWIGSLAGRISLPFQAHYSATKAAVASISDAMRMELQPHGVRVTCVEPGDFSTGFTSARAVVPATSESYGAVQARCLAAVERQERGAPSPERIARLIEKLARDPNPPARVPVGEGAGAMCFGLRLLPDRIRELVVRKHYDL
jgi:NAD(P)-dependent dehydrogenase (short-subunit alcohol dehydrogenase family)